MRTLEPENRAKIGLMGILVTALVTLVGQTFTSVPMLFAEPSYYGQLADTGGLSQGDKVRIAGMDVGKVLGLEIDGDHVKARFSTGANSIGTDSRIAVKTDTILGRKVLEIEPRGTQKLAPRGVLPIGQSTTPYQIYDAFFDVSRAASGWDIDTVKTSLKVLSDTVTETAPNLSAALDGVAKFADTIDKRDEDITRLLSQTAKVAEIVGNRSDQIDSLFRNWQGLMAAFNQRSRSIGALLGNITAFGQQIQGLVTDNPDLDLHHVFEEAGNITDMLVKHKDDLVDLQVTLGKFVMAMNEAIASGPYFKVSALNIIPFWIMQPFVDAAFKKRGIEPQEMWRNAGLPMFRYPDPNGVRLPNGAPPPAPQLLEGTPEHPGPAVVPGTPCSYAPGAGNFPTPSNPLSCAGLDQQVGPFGPHGGQGPYPNLPDVLTSPANPDGMPASPGIGIGGRANQETAPLVPGVPVELPEAQPGARSEPLGPPGPQAGNPGHAPPPGIPAPYAPAPAGPGDQLPVPFIPPGQGGNSQPGGGGGALEGR